MWTNPLNYRGKVEQHGAYSGADLGKFIKKMTNVTLARAQVSLITYADAPQYEDEEKTLISGQDAYDFLVRYFKENKHVKQYNEFDKLQFIAELRKKDELINVAAVSAGKNFPGTRVDSVHVLVTEQPLLGERIKKDLSAIVRVLSPTK